MQLVGALEKLSALEERIYNNGGELTPLLESELDFYAKEVPSSLDRCVFVYKTRENELEYAKSMLKSFVTSKTAQLESFKQVLFKTAQLHGKLQTPLSTLGVVRKKVESVLIFNFDLVMQQYPRAVVVETLDNVKTIRLRKEDLKAIWVQDGGKVKGFEVVEREIEYPNIRMRGGKDVTD